MEKLFKILCKFWGSVGFLDYNYILKNNSRNKKLTNEEVDNLCQILNNFLNLTDNKEIEDACNVISDYITENFFTKVMKANSQLNKEKLFFVKLLDIDNNLNKLEPNRWMSFTKTETLNNFSQNDTYGKEVLIFNSETINFVDMLDYGEKNEVLINSNDLLPLIHVNNYAHIQNDDNLHVDLDILINEFFNHWYYNDPLSEIFYDICVKYKLNKKVKFYKENIKIYRGYKDFLNEKGKQFSLNYKTALNFADNIKENVIEKNLNAFDKWISVDFVYEFITKYIPEKMLFVYSDFEDFDGTKEKIHYFTESEIYIFQ